MSSSAKIEKGLRLGVAHCIYLSIWWRLRRSVRAKRSVRTTPPKGASLRGFTLQSKCKFGPPLQVSIRFDCKAPAASIAKRPLPEACTYQTRHFICASGANPHPSQVSWTHASPPAHLLLPWLHSHACCTAAPPPCAATLHTHRRRHRRSLRSFTHAPARSRYCHLARHNLVSPLCPPPTLNCAGARTV